MPQKQKTPDASVEGWLLKSNEFDFDQMLAVTVNVGIGNDFTFTDKPLNDLPNKEVQLAVCKAV